MGIVTSLLYAQNGKNGTGSIVYSATFEMGIEIYCGGELVDVLYGELTMKETDHFKNGEDLGGVNWIKGEMTSEWTDENFMVNWHVKGWPPLFEGNYTNNSSHFILVGDMGSQYMGRFSFIDGEFTFLEGGCYFGFPE